MLVSSNLTKGVLVEKNNRIFVEVGEDIRLELPTNKAEKVKDMVGKEVWFGIRPENIGNRLTSPKAVNNILSGKINIVEQMGNEEFIYFMLGDNQYTARIPVAKSTGANFNQIEEFVFDMDKCHIFDIETEKNLTLK